MVSQDHTVSKIVTVASVIGSLICINILAVQNFVRVDLTEAETFTLSEASKKTMDDLEDPVAITAYFTENLPPPFSQNAQFVRDLLEEYRAASGGKLSYEFIDPQSEETDADKETKKDVKQDIFGRRLREQTSVEKELGALGISPVEIRVIEEDKSQTKRAYLGLVIRYQESTEVIPVVQETGGLEYNLTTLIRNMTRTRIPVLGIAQGHGEISLTGEQPGQPGEFDQIKTLLEQLYEVKALDLKSGLKDGKIPDEFDALLVVGPKEVLGEPALKAIDEFLGSGKSAALFLDNVDVDLRTSQINPVETGINDALKTWGVEMGPKLVADAEASSLMVTRNLRGMRVQMPLPYPFIPALRTLPQGSPVTRGIANVTVPFAGPLYFADGVTPKDDVKEGETPERVGTVLAASSKRSWLEDATPQNLAPQRFTERVSADFTGPYNLVVSVEGTIPSHFGNAVEAPKEGDEKSADKPSRLIVVGTSGLVEQQFLSESNAALTLNIVDWMLLDPAFLKMRTRGFVEAPIDPELSDTKRAVLKWGNVVVVPFLLLMFGVVVMQVRGARRKRLMGANS